MKKPAIFATVLLLSLFVCGQNTDSTTHIARASRRDFKSKADRLRNARLEETLVRTAYAKMSYADEVRIILDALQRVGRDKLWNTSANLVDVALGSRLSFELDDFRFGKISAIADRKISEFDGAPSAIGGEVLDVTPSVYNYSVNSSPPKYVAYVKFAWKPSLYQALAPVEDWSVARVLQLDQFEGKKYSDYVTYTVTVTFQGKSRTYDAWMLFGLDTKGKQQIYFMDPVTDPTAVLFAYEHSLYPTAFVETDLRTVPFVDKWLYDSAQSCVAGHDNKDNKADVCCDPGQGRCGVSQSSLLPRTSRQASPPEKRAGGMLPVSFHVSSLDLHPFFQTNGCAAFSVNTTFPHGLGDTQEHNSGQHNFTATVVGSCTYTDGAVSPGPCNVQCSAQSSSVIDEFGSLSGLVFVHATAKTDSNGGSFANGGSATISCLGLSAGTIKSCTFPCSTSVSITAGGSGNLGATISFPANALWNDQNQGQMNCQPKSTSGSGGGGGPVPNPCVGTFTGGGGGGAPSPNCSPIILDVGEEGFHLTSAQNGVMFDIAGTGQPVQMGWTDSHFHNAFLALPGSDGLVHSGKELFGDFTPQPPSDHPNGFLALAEYDKPENGGNGDGIIDEHDAVFPKLRLWIDENHDGVCQPNELHRLPELGIYSLSLKYDESRRTDQFGNQFSYRGRVNPGARKDPRDSTPSGEPGRWEYDVFFVAK